MMIYLGSESSLGWILGCPCPETSVRIRWRAGGRAGGKPEDTSVMFSGPRPDIPGDLVRPLHDDPEQPTVKVLQTQPYAPLVLRTINLPSSNRVPSLDPLLALALRPVSENGAPLAARTLPPMEISMEAPTVMTLGISKFTRHRLTIIASCAIHLFPAMPTF
ncbi:hypothetical protein KM043_012061 [Ampulex compressa]|nr:hypothetical protein KM043_012061 [Ampulex compressa]